MFKKRLELTFLSVMIIAVLILFKNYYDNYTFKNNDISDNYKLLIKNKEQEVLQNMQRNYGFAWYVAFGMAVDTNGKDLHGAGAVRYDPKSVEIRAGGPPRNMRGSRPTDETRTFNYVRSVRIGVK